MIRPLIRPKEPKAAGWERAKWWRAPVELDNLGYPVSAWEHAESGLFCLSAVEVAHDLGKPSLGPEYHLSVSMGGYRCDSSDALFALLAFDLADATEDNHVPSGRVRNFWRPVADNLSGFECPCVDDESAIRENKGDYIWRGLPAIKA